MPAPLTLPRLVWGDGPRRALLVHGLGSSAALMWRIGTALADAGWQATAVDLRGHGDAPRALDYSVAAYGADVGAVRPDDGGEWDAVIGHSLGGAATVVAATTASGWARRLVLIDPAIHVAGRDQGIIRRSQQRAFASPDIASVRAEHPDWHPQDVELKVDAVLRASRWAIEQTSVQNEPWDVRTQAARLGIPTHIVGADPEVYSLFTGELADSVVENPHVTMSVVSGAGHSPHRDRPDETTRQILEALS
ncbi:alpha/beta fold hydrolase [Microbacterium sp. NPDC089987]|uniref:alpha/beta fold hydrolase n=1 Tax=Microbacterium sp. NPDC089987 TaxID=3364202 RepID=UPI00380AD1BD